MGYLSSITRRRIQNRISELDVQAQDMKDRLERERENPTHTARCYVSWNQLEPQIQQRRQLRFADILSTAESDFDARQQGGTEHLIPPCHSANSYGGRLRAFVQDCRKALDNRDRVIIVTMQARRMAEMLERREYSARDTPFMSVLAQISTSYLKLAHSHSFRDN